MAEINYRDSQYRFTNPIRIFKANDPVYWEVDNIPLQQLEENILWVKDQIFASGALSEVERADFIPNAINQLTITNLDYNLYQEDLTGGFGDNKDNWWWSRPPPQGEDGDGPGCRAG